MPDLTVSYHSVHAYLAAKIDGAEIAELGHASMRIRLGEGE